MKTKEKETTKDQEEAALSDSLDAIVRCQRFVGKPDFVTDSYAICGRPVKFKIPKEHAMGKAEVCGMHARHYDKMAERLGWEKSTEILPNAKNQDERDQSQN